MSYLSAVGLLAFLALSVLALDYYLVHKEFGVAAHQQKDPTVMSLRRNSHKLVPNYVRATSQSRIKYTSFEKQVIQVLKKYGLLIENNTAKKLVESLRKDKDQLLKLKKLLDEVEKKKESDDFFQEFIDICFP